MRYDLLFATLFGTIIALLIVLYNTFSLIDELEQGYSACLADLEQVIDTKETRLLTVDSLVKIYSGPYYRGGDDE